jgi:hypothetical protein
MPLEVEISKIKENTDSFYKQLIEQYPSQSFMLTNDSNTSLSYIEDDSTFNEKELDKLNLGLFASNGESPSVDPKKFHITYDPSILYRVSDPEDILIHSIEQQIKFIDGGIITKFHNNDTYPACSVFKLFSTINTDDQYKAIKGVYHVKGIDFRKVGEGKEDIMKQMIELNIICYTVIIKDFISKNDATTLFLTQIPGSMRGDLYVNYYKVIFYLFYHNIKKYSSKIEKIKKIIFKIDGFTHEIEYEDLIANPPENVKLGDENIFSILKSCNVEEIVQYYVRILILEPIITEGEQDPPPLKKTRKISRSNGSVVSSNDETPENETPNDETPDNPNDETPNDETPDDSDNRNNQSDITNTRPERSDVPLLDKFYMELEKWFDGVNLNKLFADDINSKIADLEQFLLSIFEKNKLVSLNNNDKIKKIFDKFRKLQEEKIQEDEYKDNKMGGSSITLEEFKKYIQRKISEIVSKNVQ